VTEAAEGQLNPGKECIGRACKQTSKRVLGLFFRKEAKNGNRYSLINSSIVILGRILGANGSSYGYALFWFVHQIFSG